MVMRMSLQDIQHEQIAKLAYELWERNGRPANTAMKDWLMAERVLELQNPANLAFSTLSLEANEE